VLYVPGLKNNFLSASTMEDMGFFIMFQTGNVLIHLEKAILDKIVVIGVRERNLYRLQGNLV
jgi:hypothetical protein